jgi:hypothetical protein
MSFCRKWPGLLECGRINAGVLALYVPQLTIPGYDAGPESAFDALMDPARKDAYAMGRYSDPKTIDGKEPLCGELIAWRHPTFGNYADEEIAYSFVAAHTHHYSRQLFDGFECLAWVLSSSSDWLSPRVRDVLISGMRVRTWWLRLSPSHEWNGFMDELLSKPRSRFQFGKGIRVSLTKLFADAIAKLKLNGRAEELLENFISLRFVDGYYDEQDEIKAFRRAQERRR